MKKQFDKNNTVKSAARIGPIMIPLLPRHKIDLFCVAGNGHRFADLFRQVWRQIPLRDRRRLLKMWRQSRPIVWEASWPSFELVNGKSDFLRGNSHEAIAQYKYHLQSFAFDSRYVDALSDDAVKSLIAHEMAHAALATVDAEDHLARCEYDSSGFSDGEYDADEQAEFWGFDPDAMHAELEHLPVFPCIGDY